MGPVGCCKAVVLKDRKPLAHYLSRVTCILSQENLSTQASQTGMGSWVWHPTATCPCIRRTKPLSPGLFFSSHLNRAMLGMILCISVPPSESQQVSRGWFGDGRRKCACEGILPRVGSGVMEDLWGLGLHPQSWPGSGNHQSRLCPLRDLLFEASRRGSALVIFCQHDSANSEISEVLFELELW